MHKHTHTCERWDPELRSDLVLSLLCCRQSRACTVLFWRCLQRDSQDSSDRVRDRGFWCISCCVPSPLCSLCSTAIVFHSPFRMSEWYEVTRRQRRYAKKSQGWRVQSGLRAPEWLCAACKTRSFLSRDTRAEAATSKGTRSMTSTSTSGRRRRLGHNRMEDPPEMLLALWISRKDPVQALALA